MYTQPVMLKYCGKADYGDLSCCETDRKDLATYSSYPVYALHMAQESGSLMATRKFPSDSYSPPDGGK